MPGKKISWMLMTAALFAVLIRALVPAGYMPDIKAGGFQMVICTADGAQTADVGHSYDPAGKTPASMSGKNCDFNLTTVNAAAVVLANIVLVVLAFVAVISMAAQCVVLSCRRYYSVASPRAPPVSV